MTVRLHDEFNGLQDEIKLRTGAFEKRRQHRHELRILTCFIDFDAVQAFIETTAKEVRLTDVRLIFDFSEIYRRRTPDQAGAELARVGERCRRLGASFAIAAADLRGLVLGRADQKALSKLLRKAPNSGVGTEKKGHAGRKPSRPGLHRTTARRTSGHG